MYTAVVLLALVACSYASSISPYDQCYREGDLVLDQYNRCKYRQCTRVVPESGYGHLELVDQKCPEGTGVPHFLLQQYMHGVYAGHRFIGSHLASTVCGDKHVEKCEVSYGYGHQPVYGHPYNGVYGGYHSNNYVQPTRYVQPARYPDPTPAAKEESTEEEEEPANTESYS